MSRPSAILIVRSGSRLNAEATDAVGRELDLRHVLESADGDAWVGRLDGLEGRFVFNFLSDRILKGGVLAREAVNFHPAPPEYPGRSTASYALFDGARDFGATAHRMTAAPDSGAILLVRRVPILPSDGCADLAARAERACLDLLRETVAYVARTGSLPAPCGETWKRKPYTRKDFEKWLVLDPSDPDTFERKIRAAQHPIHPGPYVFVNGHRFSLDES